MEKWLKNFETNWERTQVIGPVRFNEKFCRAWLFYLAGAVETFTATNEIINCYHITFVNGHFARSGDHALQLLAVILTIASWRVFDLTAAKQNSGVL